jgi:hypothetical protein
MSRRTLDIVFSGGGAVLAVLLLVLGFVLADQGSFAKSYVKDQLGQQKITFTAADKLTEEEKSWKPGSACLTDYAGKLMETGKQAECYANFYIGLHLENAATTAGFPGETYATLGAIRTSLSADVAAAKAKSDTDGAAAAQKKLDSATSLRTTAQTGETLRGLLLTSYGFSIFGEKASQVAVVCYIIAALLALLAVAGFVHAFLTAPDKLVGVPEGYQLVTAAGATPNPKT